MGALAAKLVAHGLREMGQSNAGQVGHPGDTIHLIGPDEPTFWDIFTTSAEYQDGTPDPLDRWSRRVINSIAEALDGVPLFPFGGPPYAPFFTWAIGSGRFWASPIGFLVHQEAGLFASFRGAIRLPGTPLIGNSPQPCLTCAAQPCASTCPFEAFDNGYEVAACKAHITSDAGTDCRTGGCLARRACPVGQDNRLPAQATFHMEAFL